MRYVIIIIIGLVLAGIVASVLHPSEQKAEDPALDGEKVLIAKADLLPGSFIVMASHVDFVKMDKDKIMPGYIQKKNAVLAEMEGAVVRSLIKAGEPLQKDKIVTPKEGGFLSAVLYPGKRAVSVGVDVVSANAGFIFPGDKVDLLVTHEIQQPDGRKSVATETFVEDVRVLAIDQQVNNPEHKALIPKTLTLEVTPKQAEEVLVAVQLGKISVILRSSGGSAVNGSAIDENEVGKKTYTTDSDVSRIIGEANPVMNNYDVTVTRGKTTTETKIGGAKSVAPADVTPAATAGGLNRKELPQ